MAYKYKNDDLIGEIIDRRIKKCQSTREILQWLQSPNDYKKNGYSHTQSYKYLKDARELIKEQFDHTSETAINEAIGQYEDMLCNMVKKEDFKLWNDMNKELNRLKGLYKDKIEVKHSGVSINFVSNKTEDKPSKNDKNED